MSSSVRQRQPEFVYAKKDDLSKGATGKKSGKDERAHDGKLKCFVLAICVCFLLLIVSLVVLFLNYPSEHYPIPFDLPDPPKLEGALAPNDILAKATRFLEGVLKAPEFIAIHKGLLYTGTADGKIMEISKQGQFRVVAEIGKGRCVGQDGEASCSRPLGLEFDADGQLLVCDSYLGLFKVDVATGDVQELLSSSTVVDGHELNFLNDLEVTQDGDIFISQSSVGHRLKNLEHHFLHGIADGRLLKFDPTTGEVKVILNNLGFANGILLSEFQDYILISESFRAKIIKYHIKGINAGTTEVFVENLPCLPDNLVEDKKGRSIWLGCSHVRYAEKSFNSIDFMQKRTWLRRFLMELPVSKILFQSKCGAMLLEISENGQIKKAYMDLETKTINLSAHVVRDEDGKFYIGSYRENYIGVLDPKDIPAQ